MVPSREKVEQATAEKWMRYAIELYKQATSRGRRDPVHDLAQDLEDLLEAENYYYEALEHGIFGGGTETHTLKEVENILRSYKRDAVQAFLGRCG